MGHIDTLKTMKQQLMSCTEAQLSDISKVDSRELGDAIDMIKDLSQAIYYCTITESMEKSEQDNKKGDTNINYYTTPDWNKGNINYYTEMPNITKRDPREGRSPMHRRMYMEGKEMHHDPVSQMKELQVYLQELSTDITEMIKDASPEEKNTLRQKMTTLASKII